jgi:hypothetical protein
MPNNISTKKWSDKMNSNSHGDKFSNQDDIEQKKNRIEPKKIPFHMIVLKSRIFQAITVAVALGLALYIAYVARYKPDPQETILLGQDELYADSYAAFRILVRDYRKSLPISGANVQFNIKGQGISRELGNFVTNSSGSLSEAVYIPPFPSGKYKLTVNSQSKIGKDHIVKSIEIKRAYTILLTTDKPVYQPGQTIHVRAQVLNKLSLKPYADQLILFEIIDSKGNKVVKKNLKSSEFGIASCDFELADEVNLGQYEIRTIIDDIKSQKTVTVQRYILPKFKIELTGDKPFYLPSEKLSCSIKANYFFGKPVTNAQVKVTGKTFFEEPTEIFKITGTTDSIGQFNFETDLATYFAGKAMPAMNSSLEMEAKVTDSAGHEEILVKKITLAQQSINIHIFPEGSNFLSGFENLFYIMTAYPNGQPALCDVEINGTTYKSDENGITVFKTNINNTQSIPFNIKARDKAGLTGTFTDKIGFWHQWKNLILRTDKAVYQMGETLNLNILSSMGNVNFFVDIMGNGQTILTKTLPANNGKAELAIDLSDALCGTLKINAYAFTTSIESYHYRAETSAIMDSRVVHVRRANRLRVDTSLDKAVYQPGDSARLNFIITDSNGIPTPAALSLAAVDEAVFYVCENHPGFIEQFFLADKELLRPVYQIAFAFSPAKVLSGEDRYQNLAHVLFSSEAQDINWRSLFLMPYNDDPDLRSISSYPKYMRSDYTLQDETLSTKLTQAKRFHHRHINIPLAFLLILGALAIPLCLFGFFTHSIFRLFRKLLLQNINAAKTKSYRTENRRIYFFVFLILLPIVTYITSVVVAVLHDSYYLEDYADIGLPFLVVVMITLATVAFPFLCSSSTNLIQKKTKKVIRCFVLSLICIGLVFIIMSITTITITNIIFINKTSFLFSCVLFLLSAAFYLMASRTSRTTPGRFFSELGLSGHIVLVTGLAQTIIILVFVIMLPIDEVMDTFNKTFRTSIRSIISSSRGSIGFYVGMDGFGSGMMGGYGGGMMGGIGEYENAEETPTIREFFPETLFWQPELITDEKGHASIDIPLADSITNWKMNVDAVSAAGKLGSSEVNIPVFQDFFVDVDLPVALTRNDEVSIPVVCHNYLQQPQRIQLILRTNSWYEALESVTKTIDLRPNDVESVHFLIKAHEVGTHELTVIAKGSNKSDAFKRSIDVKPDGTEVINLQNGVLKTSVEHSFNIPAETIANSQKLLLKCYPSRFSEVVEGLDTIFRMPYGCFEQTSSVTYPNVMALLYMKRTDQMTPQIEAKARKFIASGYQRLLTFEITGGGFDWFGQAPAKEKLTAYGIMQLTDISKVHEIDQAVIQRASKWLMSRQKADGSWNGPSPRKSRSRNNNNLDNTAYIAWALAEADIWGPVLDKALAFLRQNLNETDSSYTIALAANALLANNPKDTFGMQLVSKLISKFQVQGNSMYLPSSGFGAMHSQGNCLDIETTALSALAIMKVNPFADMARKALTWLFEQKDIYGTWRSTQATILSMKALIVGTDEAGSNNEKSSRIDLIVNNRPVGSIEITTNRRDLLYTKNLTSYIKQGENNIHIKQNQGIELPYSLVGTYWVHRIPTHTSSEKDLELKVNYDKDHLIVDDILTCSVQVKKRGDNPSGMVIINLGVPPGFKVDTSAFEHLVKSGILARYEVIANRYILYIRSIVLDKPLSFIYEMKALYPIRVTIPSSTVYEYYQPDNSDRTKPMKITVKK